MKTRPLPHTALPFGWGSQHIDAYANQKPTLDLRHFLNGSLTASCAFFGRSGHLKRRFTVDMMGHWTGNQGTLDEHFRYDDGEVGTRCWNLKFLDDANFTATAHDVPGKAQGTQRGNAATLRYRLQIARPQGPITVGMEDWFYLMEDGTLINRARMTKFGLKVGEIVASFTQRHSGTAPVRPNDSS